MLVMDRHSENVVRDRPPAPSGRASDLTMDIMIPDEIKSELISDTTFDRHETSVTFKTEEEKVITVEQPFDRDSIDIVKVEPDLNAYMTTLTDYETGEEACPVKTEPVVDMDMTPVSKQAEKYLSAPAETKSKSDAGTAKSLGNETGSTGSVIPEGETNAGIDCEGGLTSPVRIKMEPGVGTVAAEYKCRTPTNGTYPVKMESGLDLSAAIVKDEPESSGEGAETVNSRLYTDAATTAEKPTEATENIPLNVSSNMHRSALVQCSAPPAVQGLIPLKIVSNMPTTVTNAIDSQGNSGLKRFYPVKFVPTVPGITTDIAENQFKSPTQRVGSCLTVPGISADKTSIVECETQRSLRNVIRVLPNAPTETSNRTENQVKSHVQTLFPVQILPNLPTNTSGDGQDQTQTGLQGVIPVKIVQDTATAQTNVVDNEAESSKKVIPVRIMPNVPAGGAVSYQSVKRLIPLQIVGNASRAQNVESLTQAAAQKLVPMKIAPCTSVATNCHDLIPNNDVLKFPVKIESELDLRNSGIVGSEESAAAGSKMAFKVSKKEHENNLDGINLGPAKDSSGKESFALLDTFSAKKDIVGEVEVKSSCSSYPVAVRTLPAKFAQYSGTNLDTLPTTDEAYTESGTDMFLCNDVNDMSAYELPLTPSMHFLAVPPVDYGIKPKSSRKPRKEKLEVKKDIEFEIIPANSVDEKDDVRRRDKSQRDVYAFELPEMPAEVVAELGDIANMIKASNKTAAELVREHGPRVKELWKECSMASKKPGVKSKTDRRQEFKAWVMSAGEPGIYIMKTMAKSVADYTRKRREKIKKLAEAGDPEALEVFSRVLENRRKFIERRRALREAGGPAAVAMAQRARDRERKRRAQKALMKAGNCCRGSI